MADLRRVAAERPISRAGASPRLELRQTLRGKVQFEPDASALRLIGCEPATADLRRISANNNLRFDGACPHRTVLATSTRSQRDPHQDAGLSPSDDDPIAACLMGTHAHRKASGRATRAIRSVATVTRRWISDRSAPDRIIAPRGRAAWWRRSVGSPVLVAIRAPRGRAALWPLPTEVQRLVYIFARLLSINLR